MTKYVYLNETGLVRNQNEDSILCLPEYGLFAVADGMGGHRAGDIASTIAIDELKRQGKFMYKQDHLPKEKQIKDIFSQANSKIFQQSTADLQYRGMGTTLTTVFIQNNNLVYGHVGDSRLYHLSDKGIQQVTQDHTMVHEMVDAGTISLTEARHHPQKHILVRALGTEAEVMCDTGHVELAENDTILLTTDGVYEYADESFLERLFYTGDMDAAVQEISKMILSQGAQDNFSLIAIRFHS